MPPTVSSPEGVYNSPMMEFLRRVFVHTHRWSGWIDSPINRNVWAHEKTAYRLCEECGYSERRILDIDCTSYKRTGKWCDRCAHILERNAIPEYIMSTMTSIPTKKKRPEAGRPPRVELITEVKRRLAIGQSPARIKKELSIKNYKTIARIRRYPDERLEKQREYAKIYGD